uniref:Uncharacterized protein n=1 Tax=Pipistrellus kuhlii TaxID=59472 RepID=A0A7J8A812_PIPKU|nr:hypothetical protein mPipKuh1_008893 [Pipistrellus kuhlii]
MGQAGPISAGRDVLGRQKYIIPISGLIASHMRCTAKPVFKKSNHFLTPYTKQLLPLKPLLRRHLRFCLHSLPRFGSDWLVSMPVSISRPIKGLDQRGRANQQSQQRPERKRGIAAGQALSQRKKQVLIHSCHRSYG